MDGSTAPQRAASSPSRGIVTSVIVANSVVFGANFVALTIGLEYSGPFTLQAWAVLSAALAVAVAGVVTRQVPTLPRQQLAAAFPISLTLTVIPASGVVVGVARVSAGVAALIVSLAPVITLTLSGLLARRRIEPQQLLGMGLGAVGVTLVTLSTEERTVTELVGILSLLTAAVSWAVGLLLTKRLTVGESPLAFVTWQLALGAPVLFAIALVVEGLEASWGPAYLVAIVWSGALSKGIGSVLQYKTTGWSSPIHASLAAFLVPVVAVALAALLVDEPIVPAHGVGAFCVGIGVAIVRRTGRGEDTPIADRRR